MTSAAAAEESHEFICGAVVLVIARPTHVFRMTARMLRREGASLLRADETGFVATLDGWSAD